MNRPLLKAGLMVLLCGAFGGCLPSEVPLGPSSEAVQDVRLGGVWNGKKETFIIGIVPGTKGYLIAMRWRDKKGERQAMTFNAWSTRFEGHDFLNLRMVDNQKKKGYFIVPYKLEGKALILDYYQPKQIPTPFKTREALQAAIREQMRSGKFFSQPLALSRASDAAY